MLAFYALFCLMAVVLLGVGGVLTTKAVLRSQATEGALSKIGRLAAAIQLDYVQNQGRGVAGLIAQARSEVRFMHGAVVSPEGVYEYHTSGALIGRPSINHEGTELHWGSVQGLRYTDNQGQLVREFHTPLRVDDQWFGSLQLAFVEPGWTRLLGELGRYGYLAILAPCICVAVGGFVLYRMTTSAASIEAQAGTFARLAHGAAPTPSMIEPQGLAAIGWNRLVEHVHRLEQRCDTLASESHSSVPQAINDDSSAVALNSLGDGVAVTDAEGRVEFANRAIEALLVGGESLEGSAWYETLSTLDPSKASRFTTNQNRTAVVEEFPVDSDGKQVTLRVARCPLRGEGQEGHVWSVRDVTQQKLTEASRDQFIDTATHELRTPLANIKAYAETLATCDIADKEQQKEFCNTINTEATRLSRFVDDLLSISSIEVGSLSVNRQNVAIGRLLEEAADKIRPLMVSKSIQFDVLLGEKMGEMSIDKDKIAGVLLNLLGNAAKYTPDGGKVSFVASREEDALRVEVRDTGVGILEDEHDKIFEKFYRSENPEIRDEVGTGLGLSLAREIARLHHGDIIVSSEIGQGSTFTLTLPA